MRVHPDAPKAFTSHRIPKVVKEALVEGNRCLMANAPTAACVMFGRALEAIIRHLLKMSEPTDTAEATKPTKSRKKVMLGEGMKKLQEKGLIDQRLMNWSEQLQAFRNIAAHADEEYTISQEEAADLQVFVHAITEYTYDLADRYEEFLDRIAFRSRKRKTSEGE